MTPPKPDRLRRKLESLRKRGGVKSSEIESFARAVGRVRAKRGKEPNWINPEQPHLRPVSIPHHSQDLNKFTARGILLQLEEDLEALEADAQGTDED